jgi:DNA-binding phage protein
MAKRSLFEGLSPEQRAALAGRIRLMVEAVGTQTAAAEVAGISPRQLSDYIQAQGAPSFLPLMRLALHTGFDLNWVATGEGESHRAPEGWQAQAEIKVLLARLSRTLEPVLAIYREAGLSLSEEDGDEVIGGLLDAIEETELPPELWPHTTGLILYCHRQAVRLLRGVG